MSGSSDGGAHLASFVGADYTTNLLATFVPDTLSLEEAIFNVEPEGEIMLRIMSEIAHLAGRDDFQPKLAGRRWKPTT